MNHRQHASVTALLDVLDREDFLLDLGPALQCAEADAVLDFLEAWHRDDAAKALLDAHSEGDDDDDAHGHVNYPHFPGALYDCKACEHRCHCTGAQGETVCIYDGPHRYGNSTPADDAVVVPSPTGPVVATRRSLTLIRSDETGRDPR
jgi:hypothetical protein